MVHVEIHALPILNFNQPQIIFYDNNTLIFTSTLIENFKEEIYLATPIVSNYSSKICQKWDLSFVPQP